MNANLLEITARKRRNPFAVADPADFEFNEGPSVDPEILLTDPLISLYCLDHFNRRALFVETAPGVDLSQAPFLYQAQYENTVKLFAVPYETLHELARRISLDDRTVIFGILDRPYRFHPVGSSLKRGRKNDWAFRAGCFHPVGGISRMGSQQ